VGYKKILKQKSQMIDIINISSLFYSTITDYLQDNLHLYFLKNLFSESSYTHSLLNLQNICRYISILEQCQKMIN